MNYPQLTDRLAEVRERIAAAQARGGREGAPVTLVAVTKTHPPAAARAAVAAGISDLAENRVQDLEEKVRALPDAGATWHLIGHLQRNKVRRALPLFDLLHSLDSIRLAEELSRVATEEQRTVRALVQVNTSGEEVKGGFAPAEVVDAVGRIALLPGLKLEGMMTMAPFDAAESILRETFSRARELNETVAAHLSGYEGRHLSMGMSGDYEIAVEEGSTIVRLGTILFGARER
jgi:PLP dependent protein